MSLTRRQAQQYDTIIVGSGAGGGMAVKVLAEAGLNVALLEAGPDYDPANPEQRTQLKWAYESPRRGANTLLRNVTATGYFTSAVGIAYLGYQGNVANIWDGVPADVLESYQLEYDEKTLANCLKVEDRNKVMEW